jgi:hypothetical protein
MRPLRTLILAAALSTTFVASAQQPTLLDQALGRLLNGRKAANPAAAAPAPTPALARNGAGRPSPVSSFDIAGVRLGDTPQQVRAALAKTGYVIRGGSIPSDQPGFEDRVLAAIARRQGVKAPEPKSNVAGKFTADGPNAAFMEIFFAATRAGAVVSEVRWQLPQAAMTGQAFLAQTVSKYGPVGQSNNGVQHLWCEAANARCADWETAYQTAPSLRANTDGQSNYLNLLQGTNAENAQQGAIVAEVDRRSPKLGKAAF